LGLPINVRLHRKEDLTTLDLAEAMPRELAAWFPELGWQLAADGAYASLAKRGLPRCELTSRMRRDAALYSTIDGAHRLSALIAWVNDDYGAGAISQRFFGDNISVAQKALRQFKNK